jgi:hypothetical protein
VCFYVVCLSIDIFLSVLCVVVYQGNRLEAERTFILFFILVQNPCGTYGRYYFPYYPDASRFIQCDQTGVFWIRKCAPGTIFDPKIGVCNYPPVVVETGRK